MSNKYSETGSDPYYINLNVTATEPCETENTCPIDNLYDTIIVDEIIPEHEVFSSPVMNNIVFVE